MKLVRYETSFPPPHTLAHPVIPYSPFLTHMTVIVTHSLCDTFHINTFYIKSTSHANHYPAVSVSRHEHLQLLFSIEPTCLRVVLMKGVLWKPGYSISPHPEPSTTTNNDSNAAPWETATRPHGVGRYTSTDLCNILWVPMRDRYSSTHTFSTIDVSFRKGWRLLGTIHEMTKTRSHPRGCCGGE